MIRVTFFSNYFNSHQLPIARELNGMDEVEYTFVSLLESGGTVGRNVLDFEYPFVLREYEGKAEAAEAMRHAVEDDVAVFGDMAGKEQYVRARAKTGKLFFRYSERLLKRGDWWRFAPPKMLRTWNRFTRYKNVNMYVLCAGAYAAKDLGLSGFPEKKCLKWGYFPEVKVFTGNRELRAGKRTLCSVQRLISWKRVDLQIKLAALLKRDGHAFILSIAGDGPCRAGLEALAEKLDVADCIVFLGSLDHEGAIDLMRSNEVFLATSNRKEGWGATINEAMASGCCVVASREMGAAPYLIRNGINGLVFDGTSLSCLHSQVNSLFEFENNIARLGRNAAKSLANTWSPEAASHAFYEFSLSALGSRYRPADYGPMSRVQLLEERD